MDWSGFIPEIVITWNIFTKMWWAFLIPPFSTMTHGDLNSPNFHFKSRPTSRLRVFRMLCFAICLRVGCPIAAGLWYTSSSAYNYHWGLAALSSDSLLITTHFFQHLPLNLCPTHNGDPVSFVIQWFTSGAVVYLVHCVPRNALHHTETFTLLHIQPAHVSGICTDAVYVSWWEGAWLCGEL